MMEPKYSFNLEPINHQPLGTCNLSRIFSGVGILYIRNIHTGEIECQTQPKREIIENELNIIHHDLDPKYKQCIII